MSLYKKCILVLLVCIFFIKPQVCASSKVSGIENFPDSYKPYLLELKKQHPNWNFVALYTGLDWDTVVQCEYGNDKNLVPLSYSDDWKCKQKDKYNIEIDSGWVNASKNAVEYFLDPRNFLNSVRIFQFESLSYDVDTHTNEGIEKILYGTEYYKKNVIYRDSTGNLIATSKTYSDLILEAGSYAGVSPYHLASRIKQEIGPFLSNKSISGDVLGFEGLFNFYNIGATSSTEELGAVKNGLQYAKDGKGLAESVKINYMIPWDTPEKSIKGGAVFIGSSYILNGQYNLYLQKFDVNNEKKDDLFWHQYMTNCFAPYSESYSIYRAYANNNVLDGNMIFIIPIYDNMPQNIAKRPDILDSDYETDNTKVRVNNTTSIMSGPGTSYEVITTVNKDDTMIRIEKGIQNGERWDKVELDNKIIGYVFQGYIQEDENQSITTEPIETEEKIESIKLSIENNIIEKGTTSKIKIMIFPETVKYENIILESSNIEIAKVENEEVIALSDGEVIITAKTNDGRVTDSVNIIVYTKGEDINLPNNPNLTENETIEFGGDLRINGDIISNIDINNSKVKDIKDMISTNLKMEFYSYKGVLLEDDDNIGTNSKLLFKNTEDKIIAQYQFVIYGDVNGDGAINALDAFIIQKYILELKDLDDIFLKAGNTTKNGKLPSSLDILRIQKHILEIKFIEQ